MLSGWLGVEPGAYCHLSDSLHIYAHDVARCSGSLSPVEAPLSTDSFAIGRSEWDTTMAIALARLEVFTRSLVSRDDFGAAAFACDLPTAYDNSILIAAADAARRRGWYDIVERCIENCANPALVYMWSRWNARVKSRQRLNAPSAAYG
jgi:hypothetical protein